jgi:lysophospholipase L1-like esterase
MQGRTWNRMRHPGIAGRRVEVRWRLALRSGLAALFLAGCATVAEPGLLNQPSGEAPPIRILSLGDSYTIGESVDSAARWPVQLAEALRKYGLSVADPVIVARTGWTTSDLQAGIRQTDPKGEYDLVTLLIGVNNQYRGGELAEYRTQLRSLLQQSIGFAGGNPQQVVVISIPDWGVTPFAEGLDRKRIRDEIDAFNAVNRQEAEAVGSVYVDITPESRRAAQVPDLIAGDSLHPSGKMYASWVDLMLPAILGILEGN